MGASPSVPVPLCNDGVVSITSKLKSERGGCPSLSCVPCDLFPSTEARPPFLSSKVTQQINESDYLMGLRQGPYGSISLLPFGHLRSHGL